MKGKGRLARLETSSAPRVREAEFAAVADDAARARTRDDLGRLMARLAAAAGWTAEGVAQ